MKKLSETDIIKMLVFLIDNIFVMFGGCVFQQTVGIPMCTNYAPLLVDLFLYSCEADIIQGLLKKNEKKPVRSFNFTFHYIDGVLSLNNSRFGDFVDRTYPIELEINDTIDTDRSASYLELHLEIDSEGRLRTKHYDKRDAFNFLIVNFPFISSNIPAASAYGAYRIKIEYVLSSVLWCPLRIQHKNDARFIFTSSLFVGGLVSFLTLFVFVHV
jgi:hypothetical protein